MHVKSNCTTFRVEVLTLSKACGQQASSVHGSVSHPSSGQEQAVHWPRIFTQQIQLFALCLVISKNTWVTDSNYDLCHWGHLCRMQAGWRTSFIGTQHPVLRFSTNWNLWLQKVSNITITYAFPVGRELMGKWTTAGKAIENRHWSELEGEVCEIVYKLSG